MTDQLLLLLKIFSTPGTVARTAVHRLVDASSTVQSDLSAGDQSQEARIPSLGVKVELVYPRQL